MLRSLLSILVCFCCLGTFAQERQIVFEHGKSKGNGILSTSESSDRHFHMSAQIDTINFTEIKSVKGDFYDIQINDAYRTGAKGEPQLPALRKLIQIPHGKSFTVNINCNDTSFYNLGDLGISNQIVPLQPSQSKSSANTKFEQKKRAYRRNKFSNNELVSIKKIGTLRGIDICQVAINPVSYNPKQNTIKVFNNIDIDFDFESNGEKSTAIAPSPYFEPIMTSLANHKGGNEDLTKYPVKYLIITDSEFTEALSDFVKWKTQKGFKVTMVTTDSIGKSAKEIKNWIDAQYNAALEDDNVAPTFLLLAADTDKIPCYKKGEESGYGTDLYYACMDGENDIIPDMYYGRFSARTVEQMKNIADKTITYEKYQFDDPSYLAKATLIAGYDDEYRYRVGIPTLNYISTNRINRSNGYSNVNKYTTNYTGCYNDTSVSVGLLTYTAHGTQTSWVNPEFTISDVYNIGNFGKYAFIIANCCQSGDITTSECLGEAWLRKKNSGAIAYIGSSPKTYWDEDFYWAVGAHKYQSGVCPAVEKTTTGAFDAPFVSDFVCGDAMLYAGNMAVTEAHDLSYPSQTSTKYYWEGYNFLGDPSLLVYFGEGRDNNVSHENAYPISAHTMKISAESGSYVGMTKDGKLIDAGFIPKDSSSITLAIPADTGKIDIVVTKSRYKPYLSEISLITPNQSFITLKSCFFDKKVENGSSVNMSLVLYNAGLLPTSNPTIDIKTKSNLVKNITINNSTIGSIEYTEKDTLSDICSIELVHNISDQEIIPINITVTEDNQTFELPYRFKVNAPKIEIDNKITINTTDGLFNPGDTIDVSFDISNTGHCDINNVNVKLASCENTEFATIINSTVNIDKIGFGSKTTCHFLIAVNKQAEMMSTFEIKAVASDSSSFYTDTTTYSLRIGRLTENVIGTSTYKKPYPFNNYYECGKIQILYTTNDISDKNIKINEMSLSVASTVPIQEYSGHTNFRIKMKESDTGNFTNKYEDMSKAQTVYFKKLQPVVTGLNTFELDSAFIYSGKKNLIVEIVWGTNTNYVSPSSLQTLAYCHETDSNTVAYDFEPKEEDIYLYSVTNIRPNTIFRYQSSKKLVFNIKDNSNNPLPNTSITIGKHKFTTDNNGYANITLFDNLFGSQFIIDKTGYETVIQDFFIEDDSATFNIKMTSSRQHNVRFYFIDSITQTALPNAKITLGNSTYTANNNGIVQFISLTAYNKPYMIDADTYIPSSGTISISSDTTITFKLRSTPALNLTIADKQNAVANACVIIDNDTASTDRNGLVTFKNVNQGTHSIIIKHSDYYDFSGAITIKTESIDTTILITELPIASFLIHYDSLPVANAKITFDGTTTYTDNHGFAEFHISANTTTHHYVIESEHISVSNDIPGIHADTTISLFFEPTKTSITFYINDKGEPKSGIPVQLLRISLVTDSHGIATFNVLQTDTLPYSIQISPNYQLKDTIFNLYKPVNIEIDLTLIDTTSHVDTIPVPDTVPNSDTIPVYDTIPIHDTITVIDTIPVYDTIPVHDTIPIHDTIPVHDTIPTHNELTFIETFRISANNMPLSAVAITLNNTTKLTDTNGIASFIANKGDLINYTIKKTNYTTLDGKSELACSYICTNDSTIIIELISADTTGISSTTALESIYPNPSNGTINIPNDFVGCNITIYDMRGSAVKSILATSNIIDLQPIKPGTYLMLTTTPNGPVSNLIVIK